MKIQVYRPLSEAVPNPSNSRGLKSEFFFRQFRFDIAEFKMRFKGFGVLDGGLGWKRGLMGGNQACVSHIGFLGGR